MSPFKECVLYLFWFLFGALSFIGIAKLCVYVFRIVMENVVNFLQFVKEAGMNESNNFGKPISEFTSERIFKEKNGYCAGCDTDSSTYCHRTPDNSHRGEYHI